MTNMDTTMPVGGWALGEVMAREPAGADPQTRVEFFVDEAVRAERLASRSNDPAVVEQLLGLAFEVRQHAQRIAAGAA